MNVSPALSLWITLMVSSCCGNAENGGEEDMSTVSYDHVPTLTPSEYYNYDYSATDGYYNGDLENQNKEEFTTDSYDDIPTATPTYYYDDDYDYNATFDYYFVTVTQPNMVDSTAKNEPKTMVEKEVDNNKMENNVAKAGNKASGIGRFDSLLLLGLAICWI
ncbi:uncharacterized protein KZ484_025423 isoform 1-T2 [Pholidichthys leucotaenia]